MSCLPRFDIQKRALILVVLLQLLVSACAGLFGQDREKGQREFRAGEAALLSGNAEAALRHFKAAVLSDRRHAQAYFELGKIYRGKDSIDDRRRADTAFRRAVLHDPTNASYHMALGKLRLDRDLISSAERTFQKVVDLEPSNADAWYQLARIRENEFLYYVNMVNGDSTSGGSVHFNAFANADKKRAISHYERALSQDPNLMEAYYRLGFLYYEDKNWLAMKAVFEDAVNRSPVDKNANLYLALSYYRMGYLEKADKRYQTAWGLMAEEERNTYLDISPLVPPNNRETDGGGPDERAAFWRQRDPLFLTDYNERYLEHFARIAYANLRFSDPDRGAGWATDQGKVYIRFGMPLDKTKRGAALLDTGLGGGSPFVGSTETWTYAGFQFVFEDAFLTRNYRFKWGMGANDDYKDIYRRMVKSVPETYASPYRDNSFDFPVIARQFMQPDGGTVVYFYSGVKKADIGLTPGARQSRTVALQRGLFLFDKAWEPVHKSVDGLALRPNRGDRSQEYLTVLDSVNASAGTFNFAIEFLQPASRRVASYRDSLVVRSFPAQQLSLSDLVLARKIRLRTGISNISRQQITVSPSFDNGFKPGQDLHLYYEIYELGRDGAGKTDYVISHTIRQKKTRRSALGRLFRKLTGRGEDGATVVSQFAYQGDLEQENHYRILQLRDYAPGSYELEVLIQDNVRVQTHSQVISFNIETRSPGSED